MRLIYYKYWIADGQERKRHNLSPFISAFEQVGDSRFKAQFRTAELDNLYLFRVHENIYLFAITKDEEIIHAINTQQLTHADVHDRLQGHEHIGFSSYLYFDNGYFGLASMLHSPKVKRLKDFINDIIHRIGLNQFSFDCEAFPTSAAPADARLFMFKSGVRIHVSGINPLAECIRNYLGADDAEQIVIELRPRRTHAMPNGFDAALDLSNNEGVDKLVVRAKAELEDQLTDYYIVGNGAVGANISKGQPDAVAQAVLYDIRHNGKLERCVHEYRSDRAIIHEEIPLLSSFNDVAAWDRIVDRGEVGAP